MISRISSCIGPILPLPQPRGPGAGVKQAMCHSHGMGAFLAILAALSILYSPAASAQAGAIEQNFAVSLTAVPAENPAVSGGVLRAGLFQRLDEPGQAAGGFFGHAQRPQRIRDPPADPEADRLFRYFRQDGRELPQIAGGAKALRDVEVFIPASDVRGGTGANFVVDWSAPARSPSPRSRR